MRWMPSSEVRSRSSSFGKSESLRLPASLRGNSFVIMTDGHDDEDVFPLEIDATVVVADLATLVGWVTDHLDLDSSLTYINDWVDPDSEEEDPVPEDVIAGEVSVYLLSDPAKMVDLVATLLPLTVPGIRVESS